MPALPLHRSFPPVVDAGTRLLLLGSLPGAVSLAEQRYYAHRRNHFWRLIGAVIERDLTLLDYEQRLEALVENGVGLWDTVGSARRRGSLDSDIRLHEANDVLDLAGTLPHLRAIGFNGAKSATIGRRQIGPASRFELIDLPSSSPAYTLSFDRKLERWQELRRFL